MKSTASFGQLNLGGDLSVNGSASFAHMTFTDLVSIDTASISSLQVGLNNETGSDNQLLRTDGFGKLSFDYADRTSIIGKNTSGATISAGTPVYLNSYVGDNIYGMISARNDNVNRSPAVGVLKDDLVNNATGSVIMLSLIHI